MRSPGDAQSPGLIKTIAETRRFSNQGDNNTDLLPRSHLGFR
jgi:hypothetical protein